MLIGNPGRKYGGGHVRLGEVTPETEYDVIDVSRQYDRASDWPDHPMNLLAFLNASAGLTNIHINYDEVDIYDPANYVWKEGNTTYVFIPTENIPLLEPLRKLGLTELADRLNGPLKERIEKAYDRSYLPDQPGWPVEPEPEPEVPQQNPAPVESGSTTLTAATTVRDLRIRPAPDRGAIRCRPRWRRPGPRGRQQLRLRGRQRRAGRRGRPGRRPER